MTTQPPPGDRFMMSQPAPGVRVTTQPLGMGDFMTTQPPPGASRDDMLVYGCIRDMMKQCICFGGKVLTLLLDLTARHFED